MAILGIESPIAVVLSLQAVVAIVLGAVLLRSRERTGAVPLAGAMLAISLMALLALWARLTPAQSGATDSVEVYVFFTGYFVFAPLWAWFVASYTRAQWLTRARLAVLAVPGSVGLAAIAVSSLTGRDLLGFGPEFPSFLVFSMPVLFSYALIIGGAGVLLYAGATYGSVSRLRSSLFSAGALALAFVTPLSNLTGALLVALPAFGAGIGRGDLHAVAAAEAIGRKAVVEQLSEAVVLLDTHGHVVDMNESARTLLGVTSAGVMERSLADLLDAIDVGGDDPDALDGAVVRGEGGRRHYEVTSSPIVDRTDEVVGRALVFRDVTDREAREQRLQVLNRILRHNLRNELQIVRTRNELLATDLDGEHAEQAASAVATIDDLIALSDKARTVESMLDQDVTVESFDLVATLTGICDQYRARYPGVEFSFEGPETCTVEAVSALELVFENLVENAAEHTTAATPRVDVILDATADGTVVTISDNGPGIPDHELAVVESGEETDLQHGSGLGLWVVDWVCTNSTASVQYETDSGGTTATVSLAN